MGVSPMSPTGVSPVAKREETAGNTAKMAVRLTGETPVLREEVTAGYTAKMAVRLTGETPVPQKK